MSVQVRSTTRRRRLPSVEELADIFQLKSGQHAGKYVVKIPKGASDPKTGVLKDKRYGPYADLQKAIDVRDEHYRKAAAHIEINVGRAPADLTLREWVDTYLGVILVNKGNGLNTLGKYRRAFDCHILPELGHITLVNLTTTRIQQWLADLRKRTGAAMVNYCLKRLKACLYAAALDPRTTGISDSPAAGKRVVRLRLPKPKTAAYVGSPADLPKLIEAAGEGYLTPLLAFVTDSGLRVSEVAALHWGDIDFEGRQLTVRWHTVASGEKQRGDGRVAMLPGSKASNGEFETVALSERAIEALRSVREQLLAHKLQSTAWARNVGKASDIFYAETAQDTDGTHYVVPQDPISPEAVVFPSEDGLPSTPAALSSWVDRVATRAGVHKTIHLLRHDCGSFMLRENVPITVVKEHLRHANLATTVATYAHMLPEDKRVGADALDRLWARQDAQAQAV